MISNLARLALILGLSGIAGCPDPGLEPKQYCSEEISTPSAQACVIDYGVCSDSFACSFQVECTPLTGTTATCRCTSQPNCHGDTTFESSEICQAASAADHTRLRELITSGCALGSDTDFSRISPM